MKSPCCQIVRFEADDGYIYDGLLFTAVEAKKTVIHVHGACGDFISFHSITDLAWHYQNNNINLLTFNLKGHDCIAEGRWKNGQPGYVGGSICEFNQCIQDIECAIRFCKGFSEKIVLQGHSMGCERILTYQLVTRTYYETILISPCDAYNLQELYLQRSVEEQIDELKNSNSEFQLLMNAYGIRNGGEEYYIPITKSALLSIIDGLAFRVFRLKDPMEFYLPVRCMCCIGELDRLQTVPANIMFKHLEDKFASFSKTLLKADHEFVPEGDKLGALLAKWITETTSS